MATLAGLGLYGLGARRLRRNAAGTRTLARWRIGCFITGIFIGLLVVAPPVDHVAHELFSAHMGQHLVLAMVVAPLVVLGRPIVAVGTALGRTGRLPVGLRRAWVRRRGSVATAVGLACVHAACWYLWHLPGPYDAALRTPLLHVVEHVMLVLSGIVLAWSALLGRPLFTAAAGILLSMLAVAPLAAVLVFAAEPLYESHIAGGAALSSLEDQQLGGVLMWFPGSLAYLLAIVVAVARTLAAVPAHPRIARCASPDQPQSVGRTRA